MHVRPEPEFALNVSQRVSSLASQAYRNLQKMFGRTMSEALSTELTCAVLLVVVVADILCAFCALTNLLLH